MNDWDKNNFTYMQNLNDEQFDTWMVSLTDEDIDYAVNLYRIARAELDLREAELFDDVSSLDEAASIIERIKKL